MRQRTLASKLAGLLMFAIGSLSQAVETPINELPLFGGRTKTAEQLRHDRVFVEEAVRAAGTPAAAYARMIELGWRELGNGSPPAAIRRFNQAYLIDPDDARAFDGLGVAMSGQGRFDQAIGLLEQAVRKDSRNARFAMNLGRAHMLRATSDGRADGERESDVERALVLFDRAIALDQDLADAYVNRAIVRVLRGERPAAAEDLQRAEAIDPRSVDPEFKREVFGN